MEYTDIFLSTTLFRGFTAEQTEALLRGIIVKEKRFGKGNIIFSQGGKCMHLHILAEGSAIAEQTTNTGNTMTIERLGKGDILAGAFLFADDNRYPVDLTALEECVVISIPKDDVLKLFSKNPLLFERYIQENSNKVSFLSKKIQVLNIRTIRGKIAYYILDRLKESGWNGSRPAECVPGRNQTELSKYFGVSRPALARSLGEMEREGIIKVERKRILIPDPEVLKTEME